MHTHSRTMVTERSSLEITNTGAWGAELQLKNQSEQFVPLKRELPTAQCFEHKRSPGSKRNRDEAFHLLHSLPANNPLLFKWL